MNYKHLLVSLLLGWCSLEAGAVIPEWAWKGDDYMNKRRKNTSYVFKSFRSEDPSATRLHEGRFYPLYKYLGERYGASPEEMALDSLSNGPGEPYTYRIVFPSEGKQSVVFAQRVDVYSATDHNVNLDPVFEYYQLYAISEKDADVVFDRFERSERSKAAAALMNAVAPGAGQLYKGHTFKGYVLLGSEIALGVAAIHCHRRSLFYKAKKEDPDSIAPDSFHSEEIGLRRLRNASLCAMAGIWAFGIYDALAKESMPNILVSSPTAGTLSVAPASSGAGLALVYQF